MQKLRNEKRGLCTAWYGNLDWLTLLRWSSPGLKEDTTDSESSDLLIISPQVGSAKFSVFLSWNKSLTCTKSHCYLASSLAQQHFLLSNLIKTNLFIDFVVVLVFVYCHCLSML